MKYTGDTPAKKVARLVVWKRVKELLGGRFYTGTHLVLLSSEAGDVSTLLGLGVPASHIVGVDTDRHALAAAKYKFADVRCLRGDVEVVAEGLHAEGTKIVSAFLDFCGPMRETTVGKAVAVTKYMAPKAAVAIAVKMGREQGKWADAVNAAKEETTAKDPTFYLRADILAHEFTRRSGKAGRCIYPSDFYRCSSLKATGEKSEMLVCIGKLTTNSYAQQHPKKAARQACLNANYAAIAANERTIGPLVALLASREEDAHLLLNLRKESVPAYKAHDTRGTYEGRSTRTERRQRRRA